MSVGRGGFEQGTTGWTFFFSPSAGGQGSLTTTTPAFEGSASGLATLTTLPTDHNVQLYQRNLSLQPNTHYRLTFAATSSTGHDLWIKLIKHTSPYTNYGLPQTVVDVTTQWQVYTYEFTTTNFSSPVSDGRLMFFLGDHAQNGDQYRFDQVSLTVVPGGAAGGAILSAAPDTGKSAVQLARFDTTAPRVVGDAPSASAIRPLAFVPPSGQIWRSYYYAGAQRIAVRVEGDSNPANNGLFYLLSDHLGSTSVTTDASGNKVAELRYYPYGQTRYSWNLMPTSHRFTGQISDEDSTGLYFFNARYYDPYLNRWIQPDTMVPETGDPQALNRFSYARGNPLKYTDPSGHTYLCDEECEANGGRGTPPPKPPKPSKPNQTHVGTCLIDCERVDYMSFSIGPDIPTVMMASGLVLTVFGLPQIGVPLALTGGAIEAGAYAGVPVPLGIKSTTVGGVFTLDRNGNLYVGPQLSVGKSMTPFAGGSIDMGMVGPFNRDKGDIPSPNEIQSFLEGPSVSFDFWGLPGPVYSPTSETYKNGNLTSIMTSFFSLNVVFWNFRLMNTGVTWYP